MGGLGVFWVGVLWSFWKLQVVRGGGFGLWFVLQVKLDGDFERG
ncbi:MAG: hypothetical protein NZM04_07815 [Methylacidiphilales bacterium]|nr:hypothetical protein [Candidatus Methylacidiphilales bacterium]